MRTRKPMNYWAGTAHELAQCYPASDANDAAGYIRISRDNVIHYMHRWVWEQVYGPIPDGWEIDHINGVRTDNRLENLRCIPQAANKRNRKRPAQNTSALWASPDGQPLVVGTRRWKCGVLSPLTNRVNR